VCPVPWTSPERVMCDGGSSCYSIYVPVGASVLCRPQKNILMRARQMGCSGSFPSPAEQAENGRLDKPDDHSFTRCVRVQCNRSLVVHYFGVRAVGLTFLPAASRVQLRALSPVARCSLGEWRSEEHTSEL